MTLPRTSTIPQFGIFAVVGAVSTGCHFAVLWTLRERLGAGLILATTAGYLVGAVVNYVLNRRITFAHSRAGHEAIPRFATVVLAGMALNAGIMALLERLVPGVDYLLRQCAATGAVLIFNFVLNRAWTFRHPEHEETDA
jgi:putative flippase GtrA